MHRHRLRKHVRRSGRSEDRKECGGMQEDNEGIIKDVVGQDYWRMNCGKEKIERKKSRDYCV